jgi:hypothetical protein
MISAAFDKVSLKHSLLSGPSPKTSPPSTKPPRPVIYLESATQTLLTLEDIQTALVRASTPLTCTICDSKADEAPKSTTPVIIVEEAPDKPAELPDTARTDVGIQVEINFYDPNKSYTVADTQNLLRQLRKLTEEHSKLEANYARLRSAVHEVDKLKTELKKMQVTLEEEVAIKEEVQQELEQTSSRVQGMLSSLEGVEKGKAHLSCCIFCQQEWVVAIVSPRFHFLSIGER